MPKGLYLVVVSWSLVSDAISSKCMFGYGVMCDVYGVWCMHLYALSERENLLPSCVRLTVK